MPLVSMAKDLNLEEMDLLRGIALSYLTAISIIHRIGKAPSMCSCEVAAALGIAAGDLFSVLHLRFPPVLPPCVAASGGEYVYAAQRGIYHSDTAVL